LKTVEIIMKKYIVLLCAGALIGKSVVSSAQDIHFSQFPEISTLRNPALTGIFSGDYKLGIDYRSQWGAVGAGYNTIAMAGETRILIDKETGDYLSFGLDFTSDKAGSINFVTNEIYPAVCYNKCMENEHNTYISVGMTGGYFSRSVDPSKMTFSSQYTNRSYDPNNPSFENTAFNSIQNYDLGTGVSINSSFDMEGISNYYIGAALYHINHPTEIFYGPDNSVKLPLKWEFGTGFHVNIGRQWGITFHGNYTTMGPYNEEIFGGFLTWHNTPIAFPSNFAFSFGAYVRYNDASFIPMVKLDIKNVAVGFSYDVTNNGLASTVAGTSATEITVFIKGKYNHRKDPRENVQCPRFDEGVYDPLR
jgi:type IX secretion system PorP/SprF family membrane protein